MKYIIYLVATLVLLGLNAGLFSEFRLLGAAPNLLLLFVVFMSLEHDSFDFVFVSLLGGLLLDMHSGIFPGSFALAFFLLGFFLHIGIHNVMAFEANWKYFFGLIAGATLFVAVFVILYNYGALRAGWTPAPVSWRNVIRLLLPMIGYNVILAYPMYMFAEAARDFADKVSPQGRMR